MTEDLRRSLPKTMTHGSVDGGVRPMIERDAVLAHAMLPLRDARPVLVGTSLNRVGGSNAPPAKRRSACA